MEEFRQRSERRQQVENVALLAMVKATKLQQQRQTAARLAQSGDNENSDWVMGSVEASDDEEGLAKAFERARRPGTSTAREWAASAVVDLDVKSYIY
jgi:hypothetical protein